MTEKIFIFTIPPFAFFNKDAVPEIENFSNEDSQLLFKTLYENHKNLISKLCEIYEPVYLFDEKDKENLPEEFINDNAKKYFIQEEIFWQDIANIVFKRYKRDSTTLIFIYANTIGIGPKIISAISNLANNEDNNLIFGKTPEGKISFFAMNFFDEKFFTEFNSKQFFYDDFVKHVNKFEAHLYEVNGSMLSISDLSRFKELYKILSKKESIEFCSHKIHDKFIPLFIEHKEILSQ